MPRTNEGRTCDAVLRVIEAREGAVRTEMTLLTGNAEPELTCQIGDTVYALEATVIEPFEGWFRLAAMWNRLFAPMDLGQRVDPDVLIIIKVRSTGWLTKLNDYKIASIRAAIAAWAPGALSARVPPGPGGASLTAFETAKGVPFELAVSRDARRRGDGKLRFCRAANDLLEQMRLQRIRTAYRRKACKLARWRSTTQRTVLVLEENDFSETDQVRVEACLTQVESESDAPPRPDEVYLVSTGASEFSVLPLRIDRRPPQGLRRHTYFDAHTLVDLTGRGSAPLPSKD